MSSRKRVIVAVTSLGLALGAGYAIRAAASGIPATAALTYAGVLEDANGPVNGPHNILLILYDAVTAGNNLCQSASVALTLANGHFAVPLPDACTTAVGANPNVWVDVLVDGSDTGRTKIGAVPYAVEANHAENATTAATATTAINATNATTAATANAAGGTLQQQLTSLQTTAVVQEIEADTNLTGTFSSDLVYPSLPMTLAVGTWLVQAFASVATTDVPDEVQLGLYDTTNGVDIPGSRSGIGTTGPSTISLQTSHVLTVTSPTTYEMKAYRNGSSTLQFGSPYPLAGGRQRMLAVQLK